MGLVMLLAAVLCACGAGNSEPDGPLRDSVPVVLAPEAPGRLTEENEKAIIDYSNAGEGYVVVKYLGENPRVKARIVFDEGGAAEYTADFDVLSAQEVFPLVSGAGTYSVKVFEHKTGGADEEFLPVLACEIEAAPDELKTFLYPSQYVNFNRNSAAVRMGQQLVQSARDDYGAIESIFNYVVENISYDYVKAGSVTSKELTAYIPDIDDTLDTKTGICFDYSVLMVSMLRSQRIPSRLIIGYAGEIYHAWVNVYLEDPGWVDAGLIFYDGSEWGRMDPTFVSVGDTPQSFFEDSGNYQQIRIY